MIPANLPPLIQEAPGDPKPGPLLLARLVASLVQMEKHLSAMEAHETALRSALMYCPQVMRDVHALAGVRRLLGEGIASMRSQVDAACLTKTATKKQEQPAGPVQRDTKVYHPRDPFLLSSGDHTLDDEEGGAP